MLSTSSALVGALFVATAIATCHHQTLSPTEKKIVGTWKRVGMDFTELTTYRSDHTMESEMSDGSGTHPFAKGTWRVEGNVMVEEYTVQMTPLPGQTPFPKQITRDPIVEFQPDKLVREKGRPPLVRVK